MDEDLTLHLDPVKRMKTLMDSTAIELNPSIPLNRWVTEIILLRLILRIICDFKYLFNMEVLRTVYAFVLLIKP